MTDTEDTHHIESWRDITAIYSDNEAPVPQLSDEAVAAIGSFLKTHGCFLLGGSIPNGSEMSLGKVMALNRGTLLERHDNTFPGPHIMGDITSDRYWYDPSGVGIWTSGDLGPIR